jgi:hypothetical protein
LTVNDARTWCRLTSCLQAQALAQEPHELFPDAGIAPFAKVIIDRRPGWVIMGQQTPGPPLRST